MPKNFLALNGFFNTSQREHINLDERVSEFGWSIRTSLALNAYENFYLLQEASRQGYMFDNGYGVVSLNVGADIYMESFMASFEVYPAGNASSRVLEDSWARLLLVWNF